MNSEISPSKETSVVALTGELTIMQAAELKKRLTEALNSAQSVQVHIGKVINVDLTCMQLLCSAHRTAFVRGKQLSIVGPVSPIFRKMIDQTGFRRTHGCSFSPNSNCLCCGLS